MGDSGARRTKKPFSSRWLRAVHLPKTSILAQSGRVPTFITLVSETYLPTTKAYELFRVYQVMDQYAQPLMVANMACTESWSPTTPGSCGFGVQQCILGDFETSPTSTNLDGQFGDTYSLNNCIAEGCCSRGTQTWSINGTPCGTFIATYFCSYVQVT
jgi:hypothetical protein